MSLIHDVIKCKYINEGWLPNYPYHLISDDELCDAFMPVDNSTGFFSSTYPCVSSQLSMYYDVLKSALQSEIDKFKASTDIGRCLPNWVYSYMLGEVIGPSSSEADIQDLLSLCGQNTNTAEFGATLAQCCYDTSVAWLNKSAPSAKLSRPATIFGEPHVIKSLRLNQVSLS